MVSLSFPVPRPGPVPLYAQIRDAVVTAIEAGDLATGDRLPSEAELCAHFRVGRPTVRQALAVLRQEGWIATRRGAGTFVARGQRSISLLGFDGLTRMLEGRGLATDDDLLDSSNAAVPPLSVLQTAQQTSGWFVVTRLRRLTGDRTPICLEVDAFSLDACPDAAEIFARTGSATTVLQEAHGFQIGSCEVSTEAVAATPSEARVLEVRRGSPLLRMERLNRTPSGEVIHAAVFVVCTARVPVVEVLVNAGAG